MRVGNIEINDNSRAFVIAELSGNHGHDIEIAKRTIKAAKEAGADAIKLQTYTPDTITLDCENEYFQIKQGTIWDGRTLYDLYEEAHTPWEWHQELFEYAKKIGIIIFSTPFDKSAVDLLESLNTPAYKIASAEIMDVNLIRYVAKKMKPVIFSTGMAYIEEIKRAIDICKEEGNNDIVILKCISSYPAPIEDYNLKTIKNIKDTFGVISGLSDHTLGTVASVVSVAMGAKVIEKHFILDKKIGGPDSSFSLDFEEFKKLVTDVRKAEKAIGNVNYDLTDKQKRTREHSRSLFVVKDVKKGETITEENVRSVRPGFGLSPKYLNSALGKEFNEDISKGTPLKASHIKGFEIC
jgi:pseudaminic acid synthase